MGQGCEDESEGVSDGVGAGQPEAPLCLVSCCDVLCVSSWSTTGCPLAALRMARSTSGLLVGRASSTAKGARPTAAAAWQTGPATPFCTPSTGRFVGGAGHGWVGPQHHCSADLCALLPFLSHCGTTHSTSSSTLPWTC